MNNKYFENMEAKLDGDGIEGITDGQAQAFRAWKFFSEDEIIEVNWELQLKDRDIHDFIETLKDAKITKFILTNEGTDLMSQIHAFIAEGCFILGPYTAEPADKWSRKKKGLWFAI